jgi:PadR family transcriptional regulator, regulatory protein PadR
VSGIIRDAGADSLGPPAAGRRDLLTTNTTGRIVLLISNMSEPIDVQPGTLALLILTTLQSLGPQHGYGIARRIEQVSGDRLRLNQGTIYPALVKLEQQGWIRTKWGVSEANRRAKFYSLTPRGERALAAEAERWHRVSALVNRFLAPEEA